ncbi:putative porin [Odoribacter lunatus]|uniref:putative porin n=1 Tax=Odoribacter lunatus TaxID=2941335 RepID=UPI00203EB4A3|nr:putative porin [Odoribacter lunatus]
MKKLLYIFIFCCLPFIAFTQSSPIHRKGNPIRGNGANPQSATDSSRQQSTSDIPHQHRTWKWMNDGVYKMDIPLDTTFDKIHNYNYIFQQSIANTYLANFPAPYESDIFIKRPPQEDFHILNNVRAYLFKPVDAVNFNTTTPFTQLNYYSGGGKGKNESFLDVWHTQNITPFWNAGFRYNLISGDGRYMNQKSKAYNFSIFSSYEKERWLINLFLNQNNGNFDENGGVLDKKFIRDTTINAENVPVNLSNVRNIYRNFNFYTLLQYNIGNKKETVQGNDTIQSYPAKALFSATIEDNIHRFKEASINFDFFHNTFLDSVSHTDLQGNHVYNFNARLVVNEHPKYKYLPGIYAGLSFKHLDYTGRTGLDSTHAQGKDKHSGTWLTGGIFNVNDSALFNFDANVKLCLIGHYIGDFEIQGFIKQYFNKAKTSYIRADALIESQTVNPFFSRYIGNHNIWETNFDNIKTLGLEGRYVNEKFQTEVGLNWNNIINYVYFDTAAMPQQTSKALIILTAWANQKFKAGHFHFDQTVYFQQNTHKDILSLPTISLYSHNYYENAFFKKVLKFIIGFDLFYNTKFYADNYAPSTMQFYSQRTEKTGGYPKFDIFLDFRIKRATLFLKYEHLNYYVTNGNYFSALDYPINPAMFKFGLKWNFFD